MSDIVSFLSWYLAATFAGVTALPLAFRLFHLLPERGYTLARPLGLLTTGYVFWMLGTLGFLRNDAGGVLIAAALVLMGGLAWLTRDGVSELWAWLRANVATVLRVEIVFLLAFAAWAYVRAYNPEIVATEKPMDFMFINAILRSPTFPPSDAWLSGHTISYYYFGYLLVAALTQVTGVSSAVAFNLALALFFALTATGALGVGMNLIALTPSPVAEKAHRENDATATREGSGSLRWAAAIAARGRVGVGAAFWPALLAPLMIVVAGNWYGLLRLAHANGVARELQIPAVYYNFGDEATAEPPGPRAGLVNVWTWLDLKGANDSLLQPPEQWTWDPGYWWWFNGARVTHDKNLLGQETEAITEMPAFSFILGDLHPHVMALPFVFLPIALALQWMVWGRCVSISDYEIGGTWSAMLGVPVWSYWRRRWLYRVLLNWQGFARVARNSVSLFQTVVADIFVSALLLGALAFFNTWDFPIYWFVVVMALAVGLGLAWGWDGLRKNWLVVAVFAVTLAVFGVLLYLPFFITFQSQAGGFLPNLIYPTRFQQTVVMFAHTLLAVTLFIGWLAVRAWRLLDRRAALWAGGGIVGVLVLVLVSMMLAASLSPDLASFAAGFIAPLTFDEALGLTLQRRLIDSFTALVPAVMIGLAAGFGVAALRNPQSAIPNPSSLIPHPSILFAPPLLFTLLLAFTGALLLLGPEFVYLRDNFGTRMNTIFKFYFQVWVLWGLAGAFGVWYIAQHARPVVSGVITGIVGIAIAASLVYTWTATYSKTNHFAGPPTLDGMAYFAQQYPDDWAAIEWLNANVREPAVIAEGIGGVYWIEGRFSRISMATGLPTVMGWPGHEGQWRGNYFSKVGERENAIQQLYQTRDAASALATMKTYGIDYLVLSDLERQKYGNLNPARFESFMRPVFQSGSLTIYQRAEGGQ